MIHNIGLQGHKAEGMSDKFIIIPIIACTIKVSGAVGCDGVIGVLCGGVLVACSSWHQGGARRKEGRGEEATV